MSNDEGTDFSNQRRIYLSIIYLLFSLLIYSNVIIFQQSKILQNQEYEGAHKGVLPKPQNLIETLQSIWSTKGLRKTQIVEDLYGSHQYGDSEAFFVKKEIRWEENDDEHRNVEIEGIDLPDKIDGSQPSENALRSSTFIKETNPSIGNEIHLKDSTEQTKDIFPASRSEEIEKNDDKLSATKIKHISPVNIEGNNNVETNSKETPRNENEGLNSVNAGNIGKERITEKENHETQELQDLDVGDITIDVQNDNAKEGLPLHGANEPQTDVTISEKMNQYKDNDYLLGAGQDHNGEDLGYLHSEEYKEEKDVVMKEDMKDISSNTMTSEDIIENTDGIELSNVSNISPSPKNKELAYTYENDPNKEFVSGLDDIAKFLEEVDPPDELDVGADGTSIQEVLIRQGGQIIVKRIQIGLKLIKNNIDKLFSQGKKHMNSVEQDGHLSDDEISSSITFNDTTVQLSDIKGDPTLHEDNSQNKPKFHVQIFSSFFDHTKVVRLARGVWNNFRKLFIKVQDFIEEIMEDEDDDYDDDDNLSIFEGNDHMNQFFAEKGFEIMGKNEDEAIAGLKEKIFMSSQERPSELLSKGIAETGLKMNDPDALRNSILQKLESRRNNEKARGNTFRIMGSVTDTTVEEGSDLDNQMTDAENIEGVETINTLDEKLNFHATEDNLEEESLYEHEQDSELLMEPNDELEESFPSSSEIQQEAEISYLSESSPESNLEPILELASQIQEEQQEDTEPMYEQESQLSYESDVFSQPIIAPDEELELIPETNPESDLFGETKFQRVEGSDSMSKPNQEQKSILNHQPQFDSELTQDQLDMETVSEFNELDEIESVNESSSKSDMMENIELKDEQKQDTNAVAETVSEEEMDLKLHFEVGPKQQINLQELEDATMEIKDEPTVIVTETDNAAFETASEEGRVQNLQLETQFQIHTGEDTKNLQEKIDFKNTQTKTIIEEKRNFEVEEGNDVNDAETSATSSVMADVEVGYTANDMAQSTSENDKFNVHVNEQGQLSRTHSLLMMDDGQKVDGNNPQNDAQSEIGSLLQGNSLEDSRESLTKEEKVDQVRENHSEHTKSPLDNLRASSMLDQDLEINKEEIAETKSADDINSHLTRTPKYNDPETNEKLQDPLEETLESPLPKLPVDLKQEDSNPYGLQNELDDSSQEIKKTNLESNLGEVESDDFDEESSEYLVVKEDDQRTSNDATVKQTKYDDYDASYGTQQDFIEKTIGFNDTKPNFDDVSASNTESNLDGVEAPTSVFHESSENPPFEEIEQPSTDDAPNEVMKNDTFDDSFVEVEDFVHTVTTKDEQSNLDKVEISASAYNEESFEKPVVEKVKQPNTDDATYEEILDDSSATMEVFHENTITSKDEGSNYDEVETSAFYLDEKSSLNSDMEEDEQPNTDDAAFEEAEADELDDSSAAKEEFIEDTVTMKEDESHADEIETSTFDFHEESSEKQVMVEDEQTNAGDLVFDKIKNDELGDSSVVTEYVIVNAARTETYILNESNTDDGDNSFLREKEPIENVQGNEINKRAPIENVGRVEVLDDYDDGESVNEKRLSFDEVTEEPSLLLTEDIPIAHPQANENEETLDNHIDVRLDRVSGDVSDEDQLEDVKVSLKSGSIEENQVIDQENQDTIDTVGVIPQIQDVDDRSGGDNLFTKSELLIENDENLTLEERGNLHKDMPLIDDGYHSDLVSNLSKEAALESENANFDESEADLVTDSVEEVSGHLESDLVTQTEPIEMPLASVEKEEDTVLSGTLANEHIETTTNEANKQIILENLHDLKANANFVSGLDDIEKFMEEVDVPDELDVGAVGTSLQDVLVGQGGQILVKRIRQGASAVKKNFVKARDKIKNRGERKAQAEITATESEEGKKKPNLIRAAQSVWNFIADQIDDDDDDEYDEDMFGDNVELGNFFKGKGLSGNFDFDDVGVSTLDEVRNELQKKLAATKQKLDSEGTQGSQMESKTKTSSFLF